MRRTASAASSDVQVAIRVRPLNELETSTMGCFDALEAGDNFVVLRQGELEQKYAFDSVFGPSASTNQMYEQIAEPIITSCLSGVNGTIFAYGQTASGKTFTMQGKEAHPGILRLAARRIFEPSTKWTVAMTVSYIEIYNERIKDLLFSSSNGKTAIEAANDLKVREDPQKGFFVEGVVEAPVSTYEQLMERFTEGERRRHVAGTDMNEKSSRSHTVFMLNLVVRAAEGCTDPEFMGATFRSRLSLVDLAGSENVRNTNAEGDRLKEGGQINKSLLTLSMVISCLAKGKEGAFVKFRDSKLTQILQPSLVGNCRTAVICCVSPASIFAGETLSTLKFANSAKNIKTDFVVNQMVDQSRSIKSYQEQIDAFQATLRAERADLEMAQRARIDLEDQLAKVEADLAQIRTELISCMDENVQLNSQILSNEQLLKSKESALEQLQTQFAKELVRLDNVQKELQKSVESNALLEQALEDSDEARRDLDLSRRALQKRFEELEDSKRVLEAELKSETEARTDLQKRLDAELQRGVDLTNKLQITEHTATERQERITEEVRRCNTEIDRLRAELDLSSGTSVKLNERIRIMEEEIDRLKSELQGVQVEKRDSDAQLQRVLCECTERLKQSEAESTMREHRINQLDAELQIKAEQVMASRDQLEILQKESKLQVEQRDREVASDRERFAEIELKLRSSLKAMEDDHGALRSELALSKASENDLMLQVTRLKEVIASGNVSNHDTATKLSRVEGDLVHSTTLLRSANAELSDLKTRLTSSEDAVLTWQTKAQEAQAHAESIVKALEDAQSRLDKADRELVIREKGLLEQTSVANQLATELQRSSEATRALETDLSSCRARIEATNEQLRNSENALAESKAASSESSKRIATLERDLQDVNSRLRLAESARTNLTGSKGALESRVEELSALKATLEDSLGEALDAKIALQGHVVELEAKLEEISGDLSSLQETHANLHARMEAERAENGISISKVQEELGKAISCKEEAIHNLTEQLSMALRELDDERRQREDLVLFLEKGDLKHEAELHALGLEILRRDALVDDMAHSADETREALLAETSRVIDLEAQLLTSRDDGLYNDDVFFQTLFSKIMNNLEENQALNQISFEAKPDYSEVVALRRQISSLEIIGRVSMGLVNVFGDDFNRLEAHVDVVGSALGENRNLLAEKDLALSQARQDLDRVKETLSEIRSSSTTQENEFEARLRDAEAALAAKTSKIQELEDAESDLRCRLQESVTNLNGLKAALGESCAVQEALQNRVQYLQEEIVVLQDVELELLHDVATRETTMSAMSAEFDQLRDRIELIEDERDKLMIDLERAKDEVVHLNEAGIDHVMDSEGQSSDLVMNLITALVRDEETVSELDTKMFELEAAYTKELYLARRARVEYLAKAVQANLLIEDLSAESDEQCSQLRVEVELIAAKSQVAVDEALARVTALENALVESVETNRASELQLRDQLNAAAVNIEESKLVLSEAIRRAEDSEAQSSDLRNKLDEDVEELARVSGDLAAKCLEVEGLELELSQTQICAEDLERKCYQLSDSLTKISSQLDEVRSEANRVEGELAESAVVTRTLEESLRVSQAKIELLERDLSASLANASGTSESLQAALIEQQAVTRAKEADLSESTNKCAGLERALAELKAAGSAKDALMLELRAELQRSNTLLKQAQADVSRTASDAAKSNDELVALAKVRDEMANNFGVLRLQVDEVALERDVVRNENQEIKDRLSLAESAAARKLEDIRSDFESKLARLIDENASLERDVVVGRGQIGILEQSLTTAMLVVEDRSRELEQAKLETIEARNRLEEHIRASPGENTQTERDANVARLNLSIINLEARLATALSESASKRDDLAKARSEYSKLEGAMMRLTRQVEKLTADIVVLNDEKHCLQSQKKELTARLNDLEAEMKTAAEQSAHLQQHKVMAKVREEIDEVKRELASVKAENSRLKPPSADSLLEFERKMSEALKSKEDAVEILRRFKETADQQMAMLKERHTQETQVLKQDLFKAYTTIKTHKTELEQFRKENVRGNN